MSQNQNIYLTENFCPNEKPDDAEVRGHSKKHMFQLHQVHLLLLYESNMATSVKYVLEKINNKLNTFNLIKKMMITIIQTQMRSTNHWVLG